MLALDTPYGDFVEPRSKRPVSELFGQYVPSGLVDRWPGTRIGVGVNTGTMGVGDGP